MIFGNDQRHVGSHAEGAGVGDHGAAGVGEFRLQFAGDGGVEGGEDDSWARLRARPATTRHARDALGQRRVETPLGGFAIGLAAGAVAGREPGDLEPGVVFEQLDEALADHSGGAEDADWIFVLHGREHSSVQEDKRGGGQSRPGVVS